MFLCNRQRLDGSAQTRFAVFAWCTLNAKDYEIHLGSDTSWVAERWVESCRRDLLDDVIARDSVT